MLTLTYVMQLLTGLAMIGAVELMILSAKTGRPVLLLVQAMCLLALIGMFIWQTVIRAQLYSLAIGHIVVIEHYK